MGFLNSWIFTTLSLIVVLLSDVHAGSINCTEILQTADITRSGISCDFNNNTCGYTLNGQWARTKSYSFQGNTIDAGIGKSPFIVYNRNTSAVSSRSVITSPELQPGTYCLSFYVYTTNIFEALLVKTSTGHNVTHEIKGKINTGWQEHVASVDETGAFKIEFSFIQEPTFVFGKYETMGIDSILLVQTSGIGTNKTDISCSPGSVVSSNGTCSFDDDTCGYTIQGHFERKTGLFNFGGNVVNQGHGVNSSYIVCNWRKIGASNNNTLTSPVIQPGTYCLTFWYYFTGKNVGLSVFTSSGKALFANITDPETTHAWTQVSLSMTEDKPFQVSFQMLRAKGFFNQLQTIAIDDITLSSVTTDVCTETVPEGKCTFYNKQSCGFTMDTDRWQILKGPFSLFGRSIAHSGQDDSFYALFEPFKYLPNTKEGQAYDITTHELKPGHYCLSFWYILPTHYSNMSLLVSSRSGDSPIWSGVGTNKDWMEETLNLTQTTPFKIVFRSRRVSSHSSAFVGLDNIKLSKDPGFPSSTMKSTTTKLTTVKATTRKRSSLISTTFRSSTVKSTEVEQFTTKPRTSIITTIKKGTSKMSTLKSTIKANTFKSTTSTPKSTNAKVTSTKPTTAKAVTSQRTTVKVTTSKSSTAKTAKSKETTLKPITSQLTTGKQTASKPTTYKSNTSKIITTKATSTPTTSKPASKATTSKPTATAAKPTSKVTTAKPISKVTTSKPTSKVTTAKPTSKTTTSKPTATTAKPASKETTIKQTTSTSKDTSTKPTISKSTPAKQATSESTPKPNTSKAAITKPLTSKATPTKPKSKTPFARTTTSKATTSKKTTTSKATTKNTTSKATTFKPTTSKVTTAKPTTSKSTTAKQTISKSTTNKQSSSSKQASTEKFKSTSNSPSSPLITTDKLTTKPGKTPKAKHTEAPSTKTSSTKESGKHSTHKPFQKTTKSPKIIKTASPTNHHRKVTTIQPSSKLPPTSYINTGTTEDQMPSSNRVPNTEQTLRSASTHINGAFTTDSASPKTMTSDSPGNRTNSFTSDLTHRSRGETTVVYGSTGSSAINATTTRKPIKTSSHVHSTNHNSNRNKTFSSSKVSSTVSVKTSTESGTIGSQSHQNQGSGNGGAIAGGVVGGVVVVGLVLAVFVYIRIKQRRLSSPTTVMDDQTEPTFDKSKRNSNNLGLQPIGGQSMDPKYGGMDMQPENGYTDNVRDSAKTFENFNPNF